MERHCSRIFSLGDIFIPRAIIGISITLLSSCCWFCPKQDDVASFFDVDSSPIGSGQGVGSLVRQDSRGGIVMAPADVSKKLGIDLATAGQTNNLPQIDYSSSNSNSLEGQIFARLFQLLGSTLSSRVTNFKVDKGVRTDLPEAIITEALRDLEPSLIHHREIMGLFATLPREKPLGIITSSIRLESAIIEFSSLENAQLAVTTSQTPGAGFKAAQLASSAKKVTVTPDSPLVVGQVANWTLLADVHDAITSEVWKEDAWIELIPEQIVIDKPANVQPITDSGPLPIKGTLSLALDGHPAPQDSSRTIKIDGFAELDASGYRLTFPSNAHLAFRVRNVSHNGLANRVTMSLALTEPAGWEIVGFRFSRPLHDIRPSVNLGRENGSFRLVERSSTSTFDVSTRRTAS
ncbi:MAG: hypothetical protein KDC95_06135 [Planctomycetes bacterium]|nr:hypothetical protein [Planctomycetota bacterium]